MIFTLRLIVFSFFIILGFRMSVRSIKGRAFTFLIYALTLFWYTLGCRWKITVDVSADDYDHTSVTMTTGEKIWQLLRAIFGMQANGNLAGNYREAFVLNVLLMIPLGYLVFLWLLDGDSFVLVSSVGRDVNAAEQSITEKNRTLTETALKTEMICIATSLAIEVTQEITYLGMFDINDLIANSIGGGVGIFLTLVWIRQHVRVAE